MISKIAGFRNSTPGCARQERLTLDWRPIAKPAGKKYLEPLVSSQHSPAIHCNLMFVSHAVVIAFLSSDTFQPAQVDVYYDLNGDTEYLKL